MIPFLAKRLAWSVMVVWVVFTITFLLMHAVPGGPFDGERALDPDIRANIEARYHLDKPLWWQYGNELFKAVRLDLGYSYRLGDFTVNQVLAQGFPISASLGLMALGFALTLGLTAGIVSAVRRQSVLDFTLRSVATVGIAVPNFVVAGVLIILFVFIWPLFPAGGWGTLGHLILPAFCIGAPYAAYIARLTRTGMLDVLNQDYIRTARAKGLSGSTVILRHAIRGAMLPVVSYLGPAVAGILTGSVVIETTFAIPGMGVHFINAATQRDYTLSMGLVLVYTVLLLGMNLLVDVSYSLLDPRVKLE